jgi:hypothetical protein
MIVLTFLLPIVGLVAGIVYIAKEQFARGFALLGVTVIAWIIAAMVLSAISA